MNQHASLSPGRWSAFSLDQQILMIGNEMNRATHSYPKKRKIAGRKRISGSARPRP